jgi:hypothetical protein
VARDVVRKLTQVSDTQFLRFWSGGAYFLFDYWNLYILLDLFYFRQLFRWVSSIFRIYF